MGLIQLGQEQVLIQPLNGSGGSLGSGEHLIRRRWSWQSSPSAEAPASGQLCQVLTGEPLPPPPTPPACLASWELLLHRESHFAFRVPLATSFFLLCPRTPHLLAGGSGELVFQPLFPTVGAPAPYPPSTHAGMGWGEASSSLRCRWAALSVCSEMKDFGEGAERLFSLQRGRVAGGQTSSGLSGLN